MCKSYSGLPWKMTSLALDIYARIILHASVLPAPDSPVIIMAWFDYSRIRDW